MAIEYLFHKILSVLVFSVTCKADFYVKTFREKNGNKIALFFNLTLIDDVISLNNSK